MAAAPQRGVASYDAGFPVWALAWAHQPATDELPTRLVACSLRPGARNYVQLLQYDGESLSSEHGMHLPVPAPAVAAEFAPQQDAVLATAGDALRVWRFREGGATESEPNCHAECATMCGPEHADWSVPYAAVAWSPSANLVAVGAVEGSVTLWDPATGRALSRWPAHAGARPAVHRVAWRDAATLLTAGADGDAMLHDARAPQAAPALRVFSTPRIAGRATPPLRHAAWAPGGGAGLLAVAAGDAESAFVLDLRVAGGEAPPVLAELTLEQGCINGLAWAPHGAHLGAALSDARFVVWDLAAAQPPPPGVAEHAMLPPSHDFAAAAELNGIAWTGPHPGRVAVAHGSTVQVLVV